MTNWIEILKQQGIDSRLLDHVQQFREQHPLTAQQEQRMLPPQMLYYGKEIWEMAIVSLLQGENLLLTGSKATGKNVLAENLAFLFGRPMYNISFHVNTDSASLIGTDTFRENEVQLRKGLVYECAVNGGFGVFDEINMAKNDAVSVLHATLDYRRMIEVPGYDRIVLDDATRFIGTMNYGYAGTRELNEALVSRFMVITMPEINVQVLEQILHAQFPELSAQGMEQMCGLFMDLQLKAEHNEISTKPLDLRGMIGALKLIRGGLNPAVAISMGIVNKCFDEFEKELVSDIVLTRIPKEWKADVFYA